MNKKVLTTAQVRAMFKNYTMSLAVAGSVLTSASCEKGDGKKDGKSGETPSAEDAKKFVTKDDLTNATKDLAKSSSVTAVSYDDATKTLTVAGKPVKIETGSGLSVADLTKKGYKLDNDKIVETSNDKEQRTIVDILKDLMGGSTGVSLDSTEFKIDAGKLVKKDATADAAIINKTVSELIVDMITDKLKDTVDKNDAKIVVKGTEVGATKKYTHEATFLKPEVTGLGNDDATREVELGKEIVKGAELVNALRTELDAEKKKAKKINEAVAELELFIVPGIGGNDASHEKVAFTQKSFAKVTLVNYLEKNPNARFLGVITSAAAVNNGVSLTALKNKLNSFTVSEEKVGNVNDVFILSHTDNSLEVYFLQTKIESTTNTTANNVASVKVDGTKNVDNQLGA